MRAFGCAIARNRGYRVYGLYSQSRSLSPHTTLHHAGFHARTDTARRWNRQCRAPRAVDGESFAATSTHLPPLSTYCSIDVPPPRPLRPLPPPHAPAHPPRTPCLAQPRSERVAAAALFRVCSIVSAPFVLSPYIVVVVVVIVVVVVVAFIYLAAAAAMLAWTCSIAPVSV